MNILALLQNTWAKDPQRTTAMLQRMEALGIRHKAVERLLFAGGSLTGRRIRAAFGSTAESFIYEECTKEVTGEASGKPATDLNHVKAVLAKFKPDIIIAFGRQAVAAIDAAGYSGIAIETVHPAARHKSTKTHLAQASQQLHALIP